MRNLIVPALVAASLAVGGVAVAATSPAPVKAHAMKAAPNPKAAGCLKQWKAEKKHTQTRKAFLAACEKA
jgi:hypothetical protein